jgi:hypothetical protein
MTTSLLGEPADGQHRMTFWGQSGTSSLKFAHLSTARKLALTNGAARVEVEGGTGHHAYFLMKNHYSVHDGTTGHLSGRLTRTFRDLGGASRAPAELACRR